MTLHTTFYFDFTIADKFGLEAIRDTYNRAFKEWKKDVVYMTELVMVLNFKIFEYYEKNDDYAELYDELWRKADDYCCTHFKGEDLSYFFRTTD